MERRDNLVKKSLIIYIIMVNLELELIKSQLDPYNAIMFTKHRLAIQYPFEKPIRT